MPEVLAVSVGLHLLGALVLMQVPASRHLLASFLPVEMVERKTPPPRPKPPPRKVLRRLASLPHHAAPPRQVVEASPTDAPGAGTFGLPADEGGGTMEVPVGETLATPSGPVPLELDLSDDGPGTGLECLPAPIGPVAVTYPELARLAAATGSSLVEAFVERDGRVAQARVIAATAPAFGRAALEALRQTRFRPATRAGLAVGCSIRVPIRFELTAIEVAEPVEAPLEAEEVAATSSVAPLPEELLATTSLAVTGTESLGVTAASASLPSPEGGPAR